MRAAFKKCLWIVVAGLALFTVGCSDDDNDCDDCPAYAAQTSPDNVLSKFQAAYRDRSIVPYDELLADDFRFYFDPDLREELGFESWDAEHDSLGTVGLFNSPEVTKITINLGVPAGEDSVPGVGKERWRHKRVTEVFLDVDVMSTGLPLTTYRVENQTQDFYFRQGRTPADTLESSPTSSQWFLVEWRDRGGELSKARLSGSASVPTRWGGIKTLFLCEGCLPPPTYVAQTSPDNVLNKFQAAYRDRNSLPYDELLADDFRFYFDPATRSQLGIESWNAVTDAAQTAQLFESPDVTKITIDLGVPAGDNPVSGVGKERWRHKRVTDVFLDVDIQLSGSPVFTYRVEDQTQDFYFRQGRTPADTLDSSPTAATWYLVEWRDQGNGFGKGRFGLTASQSTWSGLKTLISN